ncbi:MAG: hypothetical protein QM788_06455 [Roseateles sp.]|uniref:hypothetical protein n=1 Tax=Roseateles sp. TaxID=1971397 RepID=UPI0039E75997
MENDLNIISAPQSLLEQLRPFAPDEEAYGRICADLQDLVGASAWLLQTIAKNKGRTLSPSELEDLLVDIDVHFVEHSSFHLSSFSRDIKAMLENFPGSGE